MEQKSTLRTKFASDADGQFIAQVAASRPVAPDDASRGFQAAISTQQFAANGTDRESVSSRRKAVESVPGMTSAALSMNSTAVALRQSSAALAAARS